MRIAFHPGVFLARRRDRVGQLGLLGTQVGDALFSRFLVLRELASALFSYFLLADGIVAGLFGFRLPGAGSALGLGGGLTAILGIHGLFFRTVPALFEIGNAGLGSLDFGQQSVMAFGQRIPLRPTVRQFPAQARGFIAQFGRCSLLGIQGGVRPAQLGHGLVEPGPFCAEGLQFGAGRLALFAPGAALQVTAQHADQHGAKPARRQHQGQPERNLPTPMPSRRRTR